MQEAQIEEILNDPAARKSNYETIVRNYYDRITDVYRDKWGEEFHFAVFNGNETLQQAILATERRLVEEAGLRSGMRVLDVGCGVGGPALNIAEMTGANITGVNIVEKQVNIARQRAQERGLGERVQFIQCDAMHMPFPDGDFDAVYVFEAGCHMPDKPSFYKECTRVLRPGGVFFGQDWLKKDDVSSAENAEYIEPICRLFSVPNMISLSELDRFMKDAGLQVERLQDMAKHGNIQRNWELLDGHVVRTIRSYVPWLMPPAMRMLADSGAVLSKSARAGVFILAQWFARKP